MTDNMQGQRRLAEYIQQRRQELGLSVNEAANRSGISRPTWTNAESGVRIRDTGYAPIERVLGWMPGSVLRTLAGDEPEVIDEVLEASRARHIADVRAEKAASRREPMPSALAREVKRISVMHNLSVEERMDMVRALIDMHEEAARHEGRAAS